VQNKVSKFVEANIEMRSVLQGNDLYIFST